MRLVALTFACMLLASPVFALPADGGRVGAYDSCQNALSPSATACLRLELPSSPVGPPAQVTDIIGQNLFVWFGAAECRSISCSEVLPASNNAITGGFSVVGVLFGDTNGLPGLQRSAVTVGARTFAPDETLLV